MNTIAAISTPNAVGGISVIRISGPDALRIAAKVFVPVSGEDPAQMNGYTCAYGSVSDENGRLDDGILTVFRAPHSYTGEDTAEISCHGGIYLTRRVLHAVFQAGAEPAGPGEFTKRAYLNGKLSLSQAESVMDLIQADGEAALRQANLARSGRLGKEMTGIGAKLIDTLSALAYWLDDPEEFPPELEPAEITQKLGMISERLADLTAHYDDGRILREGIRTVLLGQPNAGKSTLMNRLCGEQRSIVTEIPGTTRDIVREHVKIGDFTLVLSDTAGLRNTDNQIEAIGISAAHAEAEQADLIIYVIDSTKYNAEDTAFLDRISGRRAVVIWNKTDLTDADAPEFAFPVLTCSAADQHGSLMRQLPAVLENMYESARFSNQPCIMNERQLLLIQRAESAISRASDLLLAHEALDLIYFELESAAQSLREIDGGAVSDDVADAVFARFCVGK